MTPDEQQRVTRLVERIAAQPNVPKDPDAVSALAQLLRRRPDAAYWLLRRCVLLEAAIEGGAPAEAAPAAAAAPRRGGLSLELKDPLPATPAVPVPSAAAAARPEPELRDLLGEFTNTSLLGDLADFGEPGPGRLPAGASSAEPQLRDLLGEFTNTSLLGDLADPEPASRQPPRDGSGPPTRR